MTPAGVVAGRMLAAFGVTSRAEARAILVAWTKVPPLSADVIRELLAGYDPLVNDDGLRDCKQIVNIDPEDFEGYSVGDPDRGRPLS